MEVEGGCPPQRGLPYLPFPGRNGPGEVSPGAPDARVEPVARAVSVVVPAYNEEHGIRPVLAAIVRLEPSGPCVGTVSCQAGANSPSHHQSSMTTPKR